MAADKRHIARVEVSAEFLAQALQIPAGSVIHDVRATDRLGVFTFVVEHESLPAVGVTEFMPRATVVYRSVESHFKVG